MRTFSHPPPSRPPGVNCRVLPFSEQAAVNTQCTYISVHKRVRGRRGPVGDKFAISHFSTFTVDSCLEKIYIEETNIYVRRYYAVLSWGNNTWYTTLPCSAVEALFQVRTISRSLY